MSAWTLYGNRRSGSACIEAALAEAGAEVRLVEVDLDKDEQYEAPLKAVNPMGRIPALVAPDGTVITESAAMLLHLGARFPEAGLLPDLAGAEGAFFLRWLMFVSNNCYEAIGRIDYPGRYTSDWANRVAVKNSAVSELRFFWTLVEAALPDDGPYAMGPRFSALDLYIANVAAWSLAPEWRGPNIPKIERLRAAVRARPKAGPVFARHFG
jgi:GST-like protein